MDIKMNIERNGTIVKAEWRDSADGIIWGKWEPLSDMARTATRGDFWQVRLIMDDGSIQKSKVTTFDQVLQRPL